MLPTDRLSQALAVVQACKVEPEPHSVSKDYGFKHAYSEYGPGRAFMRVVIIVYCYAWVRITSIEGIAWFVWLLGVVSIAWFLPKLILRRFIEKRALIICSEREKELLNHNRLRARKATKRAIESVEEAVEVVESVCEKLEKSYSLMSQAEAEFQASAYSPFWDKVKNPIEELCDCNSELKMLSYYSESYGNSLKNRDHNFTDFPISSKVLPDLTSASKKLEAVIRKGQTNFEFSSIYKQIRTREAIVAGFNSLGEAIDKFGDTIENSLKVIESKVDSKLCQ